MISLEKLEGGNAARPIRTRHSDMSDTQVNASDILANLKKHLPPDGFTIVGLTTRDLYAGEFNFLFGLAGLHAGVVSIHRLEPSSPTCELFLDNPNRIAAAARGLRCDSDLLLRHTMDTLTHEMGHTFGLKHCKYFSCVMQGFNSLEEAGRHAPDLCLVCLRKFLWVSRAETAAHVRARYERMLAFYERRPGFDRHAAAVRQVLSGAPAAAKPKLRSSHRKSTAAFSELEQMRAAAAGEAAVCEPCDEPTEAVTDSAAPTVLSGMAMAGTAGKPRGVPSFMQATALSASRASSRPITARAQADAES